MATVLGVFRLESIASVHEGSAVIVSDGKILAAIEEDRITRVKHDGQTPDWNSVKEVMNISGIAPEEIDAVAVPWEGPAETYLKGLKLNRASLLRYPYLRQDNDRLRRMLACFGVDAPVYYVTIIRVTQLQLC